MLFRLVPAGTFTMGLSDAEAEALKNIAAGAETEYVSAFLDGADRMRPVRPVTVGAFLLARHPLTIAQVRQWLPDYEDDYADRPGDPGLAARLEDEPLETLLKALPFRLPTETEWEYAARAGTTTLTWAGNSIVDEDDLLDRFDDENDVAATENAFGLAAMGSLTERCADTYLDGYHHLAQGAAAHYGEGPSVVRGGASDLSPWQSCGEWLATLSASRASQDMFTSIRPALDAG
ncbi:hypothetical protein GCM10022251_49030 [Phytohabitans flavus]|uniref:Sulfatase-modifying factor enzyme-like domain-containing protein n=1 Tax=Phytohabitans flavus TaxID=1076124 RepID=A0A6F8XSR9_9ACTN|nr:hypothetical protein Pflav_032490 [Phytohabitans flavus]